MANTPTYFNWKKYEFKKGQTHKEKKRMSTSKHNVYNRTLSLSTCPQADVQKTKGSQEHICTGGVVSHEHIMPHKHEIYVLQKLASSWKLLFISQNEREREREREREEKGRAEGGEGGGWGKGFCLFETEREESKKKKKKVKKWKNNRSSTRRKKKDFCS